MGYCHLHGRKGGGCGLFPPLPKAHTPSPPCLVLLNEERKEKRHERGIFKIVRTLLRFSVYKKIYFLVQEKIFLCTQKIICARTPSKLCAEGGKFACGRKFIFVRKKNNFRAQGNLFSCGRKIICVRTQI